MSRLSSAREPINPKDQIQLPIDAYPGGRNDAQNLDAQSLIRAAQGTRPFSRFLQAIPLLQNSCKSLGVRALPKSQVLEMCARSPCQGVSAEISTGDWVECALPPPPCYHGPHGRKNCSHDHLELSERTGSHRFRSLRYGFATPSKDAPLR